MSNLESPMVSVIVPVYKVEQYLRRCVDSVIVQTYSNWELILVDDGSPDACPMICDDYARRYQRIKVIHKENGGLSSARNAALDIATGYFVYFLDSDDFIHRDTLYDLVAIAQKENADIVQHDFLRGHSDVFPNIGKTSALEVYNNRNIFYSKRQKIIVWGKLYRRDLWKSIRMPIGKINEDDATTWKLYYACNKIVYVNTPYYYYYTNPHSIMRCLNRRLRLDFVEHYLERVDFFKKRSDILLLHLSQWRFSLPLMMGYMRGNITTEEKAVLLRLFKENVKTAISCSKVPLSHRIILSVFSIWPQGFRMFFELIGKAHTIKE